MTNQKGDYARRNRRNHVHCNFLVIITEIKRKKKKKHVLINLDVDDDERNSRCFVRHRR